MSTQTFRQLTDAEIEAIKLALSTVIVQAKSKSAKIELCHGRSINTRSVTRADCCRAKPGSNTS